MPHRPLLRREDARVTSKAQAGSHHPRLGDALAYNAAWDRSRVGPVRPATAWAGLLRIALQGCFVILSPSHERCSRCACRAGPASAAPRRPLRPPRRPVCNAHDAPAAPRGRPAAPALQVVALLLSRSRRASRRARRIAGRADGYRAGSAGPARAQRPHAAALLRSALQRWR